MICVRHLWTAEALGVVEDQGDLLTNPPEKSRTNAIFEISERKTHPGGDEGGGKKNKQPSAQVLKKRRVLRNGQNLPAFAEKSRDRRKKMKGKKIGH